MFLHNRANKQNKFPKYYWTLKKSVNPDFFHVCGNPLILPYVNLIENEYSSHVFSNIIKAHNALTFEFLFSIQRFARNGKYYLVGLVLCCLMTPGLSKDIQCHV